MAFTPDDISKRLDKLKNSIDFSSFESKLQEAQDKFKAVTETEIGKVVGEVKGGIKSLTAEVDNATEEIGNVLRPSIGKLTSDIPGLKDQFERDALEFSSEMKNIVSTATDELGDFFEEFNEATGEFKAAVETIDTEIFREVIGAVNPKAIAQAMSDVLGKAEDEINAFLEEIKIPDIDIPISEAVGVFKDITSEIEGAIGDVVGEIEGAIGDVVGEIEGAVNGIASELGDAVEAANNQLTQALGNLPGTDLLKSVLEQATGQLESLAKNLIDVDINLSKLIRDDLLSENIQGALDKATAAISTGPLEELAASLSINIQTNDFVSIKDSIKQIESRLGDTPSAVLEDYKNKVSTAENTINNVKTNVSSMVSQQDPNTASNKCKSTTPSSHGAIVVPPATSGGRAAPSPIPSGGFAFMNSTEELIKYFQSAKREITTMVWHWTANFNDQHHIGSEDVHRWHLDRGWSGIGYHFVIKRDGSIQLGRNINTTGAHAGRGFNGRSIGVSFVAGYNCSAGTPNPNRYISGKSVNQAQHDSFYRMMQAFYTVWPGGEAIGHVDVPGNSGKVDPGFDVAARVKQLFGKVNVSNPRVDGRTLRTQEIIARRKQL